MAVAPSNQRIWQKKLARQARLRFVGSLCAGLPEVVVQMQAVLNQMLAKPEDDSVHLHLALTAAAKVITPLECEFFALRGIALLTDTISKVTDRLNPHLEMLGILGTMYDARTLHAREVLERVVSAFGDTVFHTVIRRTIKFPETTVAGEPITTYASSSSGASQYRTLAREVLARCPDA